MKSVDVVRFPLMSDASGPTAADIEVLIARQFGEQIAKGRATSVRTEEKKKARELVGLLAVIAPFLRSKKQLSILECASGRGLLSLAIASLLKPNAKYELVDRDERLLAQARSAFERECATSVVTTREELETFAKRPHLPSDLLLALHACGGATDHAIDAGIAQSTRRMIIAPCCTGHTAPSHALAIAAAEKHSIPRHAAVRRAYVEAWIAAERTLRLEAAGYETVVLPFVGPEVTPYHLVWRARRMNEPTRKKAAQEAHEALLLGAQGGR